MLEKKSTVLARGKGVGDKIAAGKAHVILDISDLPTFKQGEILIADTTTPDWELVMKRAAAIVTNKGGRTCHAAIVSRELGIPAVVGAGDATEVLAAGREITVSCAEGENGLVYDGILPFHKDTLSLKDIKRSKTAIMMNLGNPDEAFGFSMIPNDGIGLARLEFIIYSYIKIHPMALVHPEKVKDQKVLQEIEKLTGNLAKEEYFVDKLAQGVGTITAAFYPKDVVVRTSDFKTNEYASLLGDSYFKATEDNPMLSFRGASRYLNERYCEGFALKCRSMKKIREEMRLKKSDYYDSFLQDS